MGAKRHVARLVVLLVCCVLSTAPTAVAADQGSAAQTALVAKVTKLQQAVANDEMQLKADSEEIQSNQDTLSNDRSDTSFLLIPMSVLVGVLALGGGLGVVFSIRDQHRISQLHELSVGAEVASQRRSEQTYTFFLEESQKTLTLVNDTLGLAKEATESAARTMELKAESNLAGIEESAQALLLPLLAQGQFETIFDEPEARGRLERLAGELTAIEGYRILQDITLPPYSRFVKGMAQYLADDISGALKTLQLASQDSTIRELQLFAVYWVAYLYDAQGQFDSAATICRSGMERLSKGRRERVEFERMINSSEFYAKAKSHKGVPPRARLAAVRAQLAALQGAARDAAEADSEHTGVTAHEVAEARADIFMWIAYAPTRLFHPLPADALATSIQACGGNVEKTLEDINSVTDDPAWGRLNDGDELRGWAWLEAAAAYKDEHLEKSTDATDAQRPNSAKGEAELKLLFGKAETEFAQAANINRDGAVALADRYRRVELAVSLYIGSHREQRRSVEAAHMWLISAGRTIWLRARCGDPVGVERAESDLFEARRVIGEKLGDPARLGELTMFSHLQRRAVTVREFTDDLESFMTQAKTGRPLVEQAPPDEGGS